MERYEKTNIFFYILKGAAIALIFTLISLFIFSCLLVYTNLNENLMQPVVIAITGVSILLGSSVATRKTSKNGLVNGAIIGIVYILSIYLLSSILNGGNFALNYESVIMIAVGIICGIIGGVIGVNIKYN